MVERLRVQDAHLLFNAGWGSAQNADMNFRYQGHKKMSIRAYMENLENELNRQKTPLTIILDFLVSS